MTPKLEEEDEVHAEWRCVSGTGGYVVDATLHVRVPGGEVGQRDVFGEFVSLGRLPQSSRRRAPGAGAGLCRRDATLVRKYISREVTLVAKG